MFNSFNTILEFEWALAEYTGAPFVITTDCCTHALELCLRYQKPYHVHFSAFTYLSVPMTMHKLNIKYSYTDEQWQGEYPFYNTNIWDSARLLRPNMYRTGQMQCLSFGHDKPLEIGGGGAILLDDEQAYKIILEQRYDGRDLTVVPWEKQKTFRVGYHYRMTPEQALKGLEKLQTYTPVTKSKCYPDLRNIIIQD